jgi:hypothetical protein
MYILDDKKFFLKGGHFLKKFNKGFRTVKGLIFTVGKIGSNPFQDV